MELFESTFLQLITMTSNLIDLNKVFSNKKNRQHSSKVYKLYIESTLFEQMSVRTVQVLSFKKYIHS